MDFSTTIQSFNQDYNLNAINEYNKYLQGHASFEIDSNVTDFSRTLDAASKSIPLKDKNETINGRTFADNVGISIMSGLDSVNKSRLEADRMQEDLAMGGPTSVHEAMIAAEKADLSMQMAIQVRNRILNAYTEITQMGF